MSFKEGDYVICLKGYPNTFTAKKIYKVLDVYSLSPYRSSNRAVDRISVLDDKGNTNGWNAAFFKLIDPKDITELDKILLGLK